MPSDEAGRLKPGAKGEEACLHRRLLDTERTAEGEETGRFICKECGAVVSINSASEKANKDKSC